MEALMKTQRIHRLIGLLTLALLLAIAGSISAQGDGERGTETPTDATTAVATATAEITGTPATATPTPTATDDDDDDDTIIVIKGPVQSITINIIVIYNIKIEVDIDNPILQIIQIGDVLYVEGRRGVDGVIIATLINNLAEIEDAVEGASVGIKGPIELIDGNRVTVNGIVVEFDPNDPVLKTLIVGNFLDVQGNFILVNNIYVLIVINVIVITDIDISGIPGYCWWHEDGMGMGMGHWHCDGMGMGPGMGMGMGGG
jgi:hypothetical protein